MSGPVPAVSRRTVAVTQETVRQLLDYNPDTGFLTWRPNPDGRRNKHSGKRAGRLCKRFGYRIVMVYGQKIREHILVWLLVHGEVPEFPIDHRNRDKADNRIENLRIATRSQNRVNSKTSSHNKSGFRGVTLHRPTGKWVASAGKDGTQYYLGLFNTKEEAHNVYLKKIRELHGEFAEAVV